MNHTPHALIAEVTHRCPLHCAYCSNPLEMQAREEELETGEWISIFEQAAALGMLHLHLTGGEPLARQDVAELVKAARGANLYVNLITSGVGLNEACLDALIQAGLDHIQLSFQDVEESAANDVAGTRAHALKLRIAEMIRSRRIAFTINMVVHRRNLDRLEEIIAFAEQTGAQRLEIANVQYYGWALRNRDALLPTRDQLRRSVGTIEAAQKRLDGRMRIEFVLPDYYAKYPKPCMHGWGRQLMLIDPAGRAMPCHAAGVIPGLEFPNARERSLRWIWEESPVFAQFRGEDWMPEPCKSCERRTRDFGGCRCQAFLLTGDATATDPVCTLAPAHGVIEDIVQSVNAAAAAVPSNGWVYRIDSVPQPKTAVYR